MTFILMITYCFLAFSAALVVSACILLAMWLAFGRTNVFIRMPLFLLGTLPIGFVFCLLEIQQLGLALLVLGLLSMLVGFFGKFHWALRASIGIMLALSIWIAFANRLDWQTLNTAWFSRVALATSLMASIFLALRFFFSFNVERLVDDTDDIEMERITGKNLDAWLMKLRSAGADQWNHAKIMSYVRTYGLDFSWQKRITLAYRKTTGSYNVGTGFNGKNQIIETNNRASQSKKRFAGFSMQQLGVKQLILLTFCVACLIRFTAGISKYMPSWTELSIAFPVLLALSVYVIGLLFSCLFVDRFHKRRLTTVMACGFLACLVFFAGAIRIIPSGGALAALLSLLLFWFSVVLIGILVQARHRTYRIVKVKQSARPGTNLISSVEDWEPYDETVFSRRNVSGEASRF